MSVFLFKNNQYFHFFLIYFTYVPQIKKSSSLTKNTNSHNKYMFSLYRKKEYMFYFYSNGFLLWKSKYKLFEVINATATKKILLQNYQLWTKKQTDGAKVFKINCARSHSFLLIDMIGNDRGFISVNEEGNE